MNNISKYEQNDCEILTISYGQVIVGFCLFAYNYLPTVALRFIIRLYLFTFTPFLSWEFEWHRIPIRV